MKKLCYYGDPSLRKVCREVGEIDDHVLKIIEEMKETLKAHNGSGLAAPQIGYDLRIFLNILGDDEDLEEPDVYINPVITKFSKRKFTVAEGCLSIPGVVAEVVRSYEINIEFTNMKGERVTKNKLRRWEAKCLQHELDHLNGVLHIDHLSEKELSRFNPVLVNLESRTKASKNKSVMPKDIF